MGTLKHAGDVESAICRAIGFANSQRAFLVSGESRSVECRVCKPQNKTEATQRKDSQVSGIPPLRAAFAGK